MAVVFILHQNGNDQSGFEWEKRGKERERERERERDVKWYHPIDMNERERKNYSHKGLKLALQNVQDWDSISQHNVK